ncbi:uncharacterized protein LOC121867520 [Homarus americanus]|uniref:uncharacterized protein LOC121867520 n=1 Tax=Homarus americanus TaxID=6706 RepID=UPI001C438CFB|nr:uncharacterized protein LOC121867520 [Homarus americanus]
MVTRAGKQRELSSTYQSFADTGPTYSYLDLSRARSDESLMWAAGEEAAALVAELRASLAAPLMRPEDEEEYMEEEDLDISVALGRSTMGRASLDRSSLGKSSIYSAGGRSLSFTDLHSAATSAEDLRIFCFHPSRLPCSAHCSPSPHSSSSSSSSASSTASSRSAASTCSSGANIIGSGGIRRPNMRTFGGSWRSLLKLGGMSGRGKPTAAVKVSPPTVPDSAGGVTHRHSGSSFSSGVYSAGDQRSSYSSSVSDDNPPPSPRSPARGTYHTIIPGTYHITNVPLKRYTCHITIVSLSRQRYVPC